MSNQSCPLFLRLLFFIILSSYTCCFALFTTSFQTLNWRPQFQNWKPKYDRCQARLPFLSTSPISAQILKYGSKAAQFMCSQDDESHPFTDPKHPLVTGVTLKIAFDQSDIWGVADNAEIKSERFTSSSSLDLVHRLRRLSDCVLVGRGTVERDDCTLTVRRVPPRRIYTGSNSNSNSFREIQPARVIIDPNLTLLKSKNDNEHESVSFRYKILNDGLSTIVYYSSSSSSALESIQHDQTIQMLEERENIILMGLSHQNANHDQNYLSPQTIIHDLNQKNINHIMVEGGPATALSFLRAKVIDRAIIIRAPVTFKDPVPSNMSEQILIHSELKKLGSRESDGDIVEYWTKDGQPWPSGDSLEQWP